VSYASIMVYVEADRAPEKRVRLAASLANRFNAALTGMSALAIQPPLVIDGRVIDEMTGVDVELLKAKLADTGTWFRGLVHNERVGWRSVLDYPSDALVREARYADLVVIGNNKRRGSAYRTLNTGEAVLKLGRPALVVPDGVSTLRGERVVIGWKDLVSPDGPYVMRYRFCNMHPRSSSSKRVGQATKGQRWGDLRTLLIT
jgi:hypothetical protein